VNAASGTWPPFGKVEEDAIGPPPKALSEGIVLEVAEDAVEDKLTLAADTELDGPNNWVPEDPPATRPEELLAPVRMYSWRRSKAFF
jgi:hypothetical protein